MKRKYGILLITSIVVLLLDQAAKAVIQSRFSLGGALTVIPGVFDITHIRNYGVAFGMFSGAGRSAGFPILLLAPILILAFVLFEFRKLDAADVLRSWAFSLVVGGAFGNIIDRLRLGYVVDFLDFHWNGRWHYPAFNLADAFICSGVGLLFLVSFFSSKSGAITAGIQRKAL